MLVQGIVTLPPKEKIKTIVSKNTYVRTYFRVREVHKRPVTQISHHATEETKEVEERMCPVRKFWPWWPRRQKKWKEEMCTVIRSEMLHSEATDIFMAGEPDRRPLTQILDHANRGDRRRRGRGCVTSSDRRCSTRNPRISSGLARRTDVLWRKFLTTRSEETEEGDERMYLVISSEMLHFDPTDVFMISQADRRSLMQSCDHADRGDKERKRGGDISRHQIRDAPFRTHGCLYCWRSRETSFDAKSWTCSRGEAREGGGAQQHRCARGRRKEAYRPSRWFTTSP